MYNFSAPGGRMTDGYTDFVHEGGNVWLSLNGYTTIQFDSPEYGYIWNDLSGVEGTLHRLTWG